MERTISRKSSSGVGSRSSRSARSEDEVFTDAVTDFTDGPGPGEPSEGGMQRFYSMQNVNDSDFDDIKHTAENGGAGETIFLLFYPILIAWCMTNE